MYVILSVVEGCGNNLNLSFYVKFFDYAQHDIVTASMSGTQSKN